MENEVRAYAVHITQKNTMMSVCSQDVADTISEFGIGVAKEPEDPARYLASIICKSEEDAKNLAVELEAIGLDVVEGSGPCYIGAEYAWAANAPGDGPEYEYMDCIMCGGEKTLKTWRSAYNGHMRGTCSKCGMRFIE